MKQFWKMVLAVICGLFIMGFIGLFLLTGFIGALAGSSSSEPVVPREGVLTIGGDRISEKGGSDSSIDYMSLLSGGLDLSSSVSLLDAVTAIGKAAEDPAIKYIYIKADEVMMDLTSAEEIRAALTAFHESGKSIVAYTENIEATGLWLASAADKIYASSIRGTAPMVYGMGTQLIYFKDLLDKIGVNVQLIRHGKYKSAGEPFIRSTPSEDNLRQNREMISSIWENISSDIEKSRSLAPGTLDKLIEDLSLVSNGDLVCAGLADELLTPAELREKLSVLAGKKDIDDVKFISLSDYAKARVKPNLKAPGKIAVIVADGEIVDAGSGGIIGSIMYETIGKVAADKDIKAVVFRVNSPGGSVIASDRIRAAIDSLRAKKPVIASYGGYAASGGYWISSSCDKIFTDRTTLTGSIGVFSIIPDLSKVAKDKAHLGIYTVGSSSHADLMGMMRPLSDAELAYMQQSVENIYDSFVGLVAEGRSMTREAVDEIAQGRVWTGSQSIGIGLTDEIGTLQDALSFAASCAGDPETGNWNVEIWPKPKTQMEQILEMLGQGGSQAVLRGTPFEGVEKAMREWDWNRSERNFARMPWQFVIR